MTRKEMKALAKEKLKGNWGVAILVLLAVSIASAVASSAFGILELVVLGPFAVGLCCVFLSMIRGNKPTFDNLFEGFNHFFNTFVVGILVTAFEFLWGLLFIIPGIIKHYSYAMTYFIQYDHPEYSETDAITESRQMMKGHNWELFVLDLSFIGWYLLCGLTFGLLLLYVAPYHHAVKAAFYENLLAQQGEGSLAKKEEQPETPAQEEAPVQAEPAQLKDAADPAVDEVLQDNKDE